MFDLSLVQTACFFSRLGGKRPCQREIMERAFPISPAAAHGPRKNLFLAAVSQLVIGEKPTLTVVLYRFLHVDIKYLYFYYSIPLSRLTIHVDCMIRRKQWAKLLALLLVRRKYIKVVQVVNYLIILPSPAAAPHVRS
jgi:hypothetical protein